MRRPPAWISALATVGLVAATALGQTSYPMISRIEPTAVQRGKSVEITVAGAGDFSGASAVLVEGRGLSGEPIATPKPEAAEPKAKGKGGGNGSTRIKLTAAADAAPGVREVRVATPQGVSTTALIVVADDPVVTEADDKANSTPKGAQTLALPVVVSGKIGAVEDVDHFDFEVAAGQTVAFSIWGNRLQNKIHDLQTHLDPILILRDDRGRELATDDNHDFADPLLIHTFDRAGRYVVEVRDSNYGGNANWTYVLQATSRPFVTAVFPTAANPGKTSRLTGRGANFDAGRPLTIDVPADTPAGPLRSVLETDRGRSQSFPVVITLLPIVEESADAASDPKGAQRLTLPAAACGRLAERNDLDSYAFEARKGVTYAFEVVARRAGSAADPVLRVMDATGKVAAEVDDTPGSGKDPRLEWAAPADGTYAIQVGDLHSRGGPEFGYTLLAEPARPDFTATCDPDKINIGPGSRTAVFIKVARRGGFDGPVAFAFEGLPPGVTASPLTVPAKATQGLIVIAAADDAKPAAGLVAVRGVARLGPAYLVRLVDPIQEIYMPGGGRGLYPVATLPLAVTKPSDIRVEAKQAEVVLRPGESATIDVTVTRQGDYSKGVSLDLNLEHLGRVFATTLPAGVTMVEKGSKTLLGPRETEGKIVLQAAADAPPCDRVPVAVLGHVSINFVVKTAYSSAPIRITVPAK